MASIKSVLKSFRGSQPFNGVATTLVKGTLGIVGWTPELVIKHLHRVGIARAKLPNGEWLQLSSFGDDWVSNQVYWRGWDGYDPETVPLFFHLAERAQVVLDIGAYVGFYALLAGHANQNAKVYAFEPMPALHERLLRNVALNQLKNVDCQPYAVGEVEGSAEFYYVAEPMPTNSSLSYKSLNGASDVRTLTVPVIQIDRFVETRKIGRVDLLKLDTETTEAQVLRGMRGTLERDRPHLICEVLAGCGTEPALEEVLGPLGYQYFLLTPRGPERTDRIVGHSEWLNYLMTTLSVDELARVYHISGN